MILRGKDKTQYVRCVLLHLCTLSINSIENDNQAVSDLISFADPFESSCTMTS